MLSLNVMQPVLNALGRCVPRAWSFLDSSIFIFQGRFKQLL